uniref:Secreted protein n=1 Tax=Steinernema glaseri TaxID=37863 RepID=A0A1I7Y8D4_9BILA
MQTLKTCTSLISTRSGLPYMDLRLSGNGTILASSFIFFFYFETRIQGTSLWACCPEIQNYVSFLKANGFSAH